MGQTGDRSGTQPLPTGTSSTEPLAAGGGPTERDRRLWLVAGILALVLVFFVGFLVGRAQAPDPGGGGTQQRQSDGGRITDRQACGRAVKLLEKAVALNLRALANRAALAEATAEGDTEVIAGLQEEIRLISRRFERTEKRAERFADRCQR
jgi:hypothetical protein